MVQLLESALNRSSSLPHPKPENIEHENHDLLPNVSDYYVVACSAVRGQTPTLSWLADLFEQDCCIPFQPIDCTLQAYYAQTPVQIDVIRNQPTFRGVLFHKV